MPRRIRIKLNSRASIRRGFKKLEREIEKEMEKHQKALININKHPENPGASLLCLPDFFYSNDPG